MLIDISVLF